MQRILHCSDFETHNVIVHLLFSLSLSIQGRGSDDKWSISIPKVRENSFAIFETSSNPKQF